MKKLNTYIVEYSPILKYFQLVEKETENGERSNPYQYKYVAKHVSRPVFNLFENFIKGYKPTSTKEARKLWFIFNLVLNSIAQRAKIEFGEVTIDKTTIYDMLNWDYLNNSIADWKYIR